MSGTISVLSATDNLENVVSNKYIRPNDGAPLYRELALLGAFLFGDGPPDENNDDPDILEAPDYSSYLDFLSGLFWAKRDGEWKILAPPPPPPLFEYFYELDISDPEQRPQCQLSSPNVNDWDVLIMGNIARPNALQPGAPNPDPSLLNLTDGGIPPSKCEFTYTGPLHYMNLSYNISAQQLLPPVDIKFAVIYWQPPTPDPVFPLSNAEYESTYRMDAGQLEDVDRSHWVGTLSNLSYATGGKFAIVASTTDTFNALLLVQTCQIDWRGIPDP